MKALLGGLVVTSAGRRGDEEASAGDDNKRALLAHAHACLQHCSQAASSLFGSTRGGRQTDEVAQYPVVMAHRDAMHRIQSQQQQQQQPPPPPRAAAPASLSRRHAHRCEDGESMSRAWLDSSGLAAESDIWQPSRASRDSTLASGSLYCNSSRPGAVAPVLSGISVSVRSACRHAARVFPEPQRLRPS